MMKQADVAPLLEKWTREMEGQPTELLLHDIHMWLDEVTKLQLRVIAAQAIIAERREEVNG